MNYLSFARVQKDERIEQLIGPGHNLIARKRSGLLRDNLSQVHAGDKLHYQKRAFAFREIVTHAWQRWMTELRQQPCFLLELPAQAIVNRKSLLQGHGRIESLIHCFVNSAHAALSQWSQDLVVPNNFAWPECHRLPKDTPACQKR